MVLGYDKSKPKVMLTCHQGFKIQIILVQLANLSDLTVREDLRPIPIMFPSPHFKLLQVNSVIMNVIWAEIAVNESVNFLVLH